MQFFNVITVIIIMHIMTYLVGELKLIILGAMLNMYFFTYLYSLGNSISQTLQRLVTIAVVTKGLPAKLP